MYIMNPLTKSEEQIRESLFKETPIGTHLDDVIKYIESQRKWEVRTIHTNMVFIIKVYLQEER